MSAYNYRAFIKDCLDLSGLPIANSVCLSFSITKDLLSVATSTFNLLYMPTNIKNGDVLGLVDPYGTLIYTGVINSIGSEISCRAITSIFNDNWKYHDNSQTTIEGKIKKIIEDDFIDSSDPMVADRFPFTVTASSSTSGTIESKDDTTIMDFESFLMNMYNAYGVITDIRVPFNGSPTIELKQATHPSIKVGNNALSIQNMTPFTEVFETNKLVIYDQEGTTLRGTYYTTTQGITTNKNDPLRLPVTKTKFIFDTDTPLDDIKQENLQEEIYNHKISFDLLLNNGLYDFYDWELGMPLEIWFNGAYYNTIFTSYSMSKDMNVNVTSVSITCGKVRNTLTEKLNSYETPQGETVNEVVNRLKNFTYAYCTISGTTVTLRNSVNVASVEVTGTGVMVVTLSKAMPSVNYPVFVSAETSGNGTEILCVYKRTTTSFIVDCSNYSGELKTPSQLSVMAFG